MDTALLCPNCGKALVPGAPQGLCPECLMKSGFETKSNESGGKSGFVPPPIEQMAKVFTQLEIIELLGHGGMGAVYKARQPHLNRFVALKILSPERQNDPQFAERFQREARALATLAHPNIVTVYDFGQAQGIYYVLMEFVDGPTLRQLFQTRRLSPGEALKIVPKICEALEYAHEQGVVHRDIKPENILLDKRGQVKIADFGIAKLMVPETKEVSLTGAKDVVGTVHYMAPEQVEKPREVDHRADIYSLGVVFYEMLTGELPLGRFQPPSKKVRIDVRLDEVVLHALEKEPERRYQTAHAVRTDVETIATTPGADASPTPPVAAVSPTESRARRKTNGWKLVAAIASAVALIAIILLINLAARVGGKKPAVPPSADLVAWWAGNNNARNSAAGINNGELVNGVKFADGIRGKCFQFDGKGAYVKIPQSPSLNPEDQLTIAFWMKADPENKMDSYQGLVTSDFYHVEISNGRGGRMGVNFVISTETQDGPAQKPGGDHPIRLKEQDNLVEKLPSPDEGVTGFMDYVHISDANGGGAPIDHQWHYIVGTYDGTKLQLYIDGQPWGTPMFHTGAIRPMRPNSFVSIGSEDGRTTCPDCIGSRYFNGLIDEVKIYNRALGPQEIATSYRIGVRAEPEP